MQNLYSIIKANTPKFGDRVLIKYRKDNKVIEKTYSDLFNDSNKLINYFTQENIKNKKIAIISENSYEFFVCFIAGISTNNILIPLDNRLPEDKLDYLIKTSETSILLYSNNIKGLVDKLNTQVQKYCMQDLLLVDASTELPNVDSNPDDVCLIMYTSGSTGESKGVMLSQNNFIINTKAIIETANMPERYSELSVLPMFHIYALSLDVIWPLLYGNTIVLSSGMSSILSELKEFNIYHICVVPMLAEYICNALLLELKKNPACSRQEIKNKVVGDVLKRFAIGGAYINTELRKELQSFGIDAYVGYGMTECVVVATDEGVRIKKGAVGQVLPCNTIKIIDDEICIKGQNVMKGYYNNPEATAEVLIDGYLHSGDIGYLDINNYLYIIGKKKNLIITSNGENVSPEELEKQLLEFEGIKELIVYQKNDIIALEVFPDMKYFNGKDQKEILKYFSEKVRLLNNKNPGYKHIKEISLRDTEFEKTSTMKIKRENYYYK